MIKFFKNTYIFLPIIYLVGAALDSGETFWRDAPYGLPFLALGIYFLWVYKVNCLLLSIAYLCHVIFDLVYFWLVETSYMMPLYEEICIVYDLVVALIIFKKKN